jgi:hypothetical protein
MDEGCNQPLSSDPKIHLNTTIFLFLSLYPVCEESPQLGVSRPYKRWSQMNKEVRMVWATHTSSQQYAHTHGQDLSSNEYIKVLTRTELKSLRMSNECARTKCEWSRMLKVCFVYSSMHLGVPFIAPRQLGTVESIPGRQFLPSVDWRTGQSGAPPDTVWCEFLSCSGAADRWRFGAVGAPDTVWCTPDSPVPLQTIGLATRHARIAWPTVGSADCWLTGQSGAHRIVRWILAIRRRRISESGLFTRASLAHRTLSGAPPDSPVHPDWAESWLLEPSLFQLSFLWF